MATCHHLSGATWRKQCSPTVGQPPVNRRRTSGQRWRSTTVNGGGPPVNHRWTTVGPLPDHQSMVVNGGGPPVNHRWTTAGPPVNGGQPPVKAGQQLGIGPGQVGSWAG
ncbi:hypothetical protein Tco_0867594, partial [Tanacetum coccineum]